MSGPGFRSLKARYVFPATSPPVRDGVVTMRGGVIVSVGAGPDAGPVEDLGNVAILPGLVNAHTHLEFSGLASPIGRPGMGFADWVRLLVEAFRTPAPHAGGAARLGTAESLRHGTTTLGEIAQPGWPAELFMDFPLDATVFLELIAPTPARVPEKIALARRHVVGGVSDGDRPSPPAPLPQAGEGRAGPWRPGLSPHAPYSVQPELLAATVALCAEHRAPLAMHLAESREELELLRTGGGPLRELLESWGQWDPSLVRPESRPLDYLRTVAGAGRALVIHGNYLDDEEIAYLAARKEHMAVVYCPRTHAFFGHDPYPLEKMLAAGVRVVLGTDSRASSPDLSVLAEMRHVATRFPSVAPHDVLRMATAEAAQALGQGLEAGSLAPGKRADLAAVLLPEREALDPHELLFDFDLPVAATWREGRRAWPR